MARLYAKKNTFGLIYFLIMWTKSGTRFGTRLHESNSSNTQYLCCKSGLGQAHNPKVTGSSPVPATK